ncbi:MAG: hypothetical protein AAFO77_05600, partial [Pseudomonadota bacterium]
MASKILSQYRPYVYRLRAFEGDHTTHGTRHRLRALIAQSGVLKTTKQGFVLRRSANAYVCKAN